jgi:asparagine synthase (glutamine-hydrolysing)
MCGIFACVSHTPLNTREINSLRSAAQRIQHRGPDETREICITDKLLFIFHRLAINGLANEHGEPLQYDDCTLMCNGEIYNHHELAAKHNCRPITQNDCEIIMHLYRRIGIVETVRELRGEFAFVLYDARNGRLHVANDQIGVRPLFVGESQSWRIFASEPCALYQVCDRVSWFPPGYVDVYESGATKAAIHYRWFDVYAIKPDRRDSHDTLRCLIRNELTQAVSRRVTNTERPLACLLSGGLDSSLVCALAARIIAPRQLHTYTIGFGESPDILAARKVASFIKSVHHEYIVTPKEMLDRLEEVVVAIQSYDVTSVRASAFNYMLARYIAETSDFVVILNGDCSEEVHASYAYSRFAPSPEAFLADNRRLLDEVHYYDVLRSARCVEAFGMEARTPFSDLDYITLMMSIPSELKMWGPTHQYKLEKGLLRESFANSGLLPDEIIQRPKTAFSDGISLATDSWHIMVQKYFELHADEAHVDWKKSLHQWAENGMAVGPTTPEAFYYAYFYRQAYGNRTDMWSLIPAHWMPRFVTATDPSARTLQEVPPV